MTYAGTAAALALSLLLAPAAVAAGETPVGSVPPPAGPLAVTIVSLEGSGCLAGTSMAAVSPGNDSITATFSNYLAAAGADAPYPADRRKECRQALEFVAPEGMSYAVTGVSYRGYAHLAPGAVAAARGTFRFEGGPLRRDAEHTVVGPLEGGWEFTDVVDEADLSWQPCGERRPLVSDTELRVGPGTSDPASTSYVTADPEEGAFLTYRLAWKRC